MSKVFIKEFGRSYTRIFRRMAARPISIVAALLAGILGLGIIIWLPNVQLLTLVFESPRLGISDQVTFLFDLYPLVFRTLGAIQIACFILFALIFGLVTVLTIGITRRRKHTRTDTDIVGSLMSAVTGCGLSAIGGVLLTPIVTTDGLSINVSLHVIGTLLGLLGIFLSIRGIYKIGKVLPDHP